MTPASHYADRAFASVSQAIPPTHDELERLFAECQAEALRWAADQIPMPSLIYTAKCLRTEADRLTPRNNP